MLPKDTGFFMRLRACTSTGCTGVNCANPYICRDNLTCMNDDFHCLDLRERANLILKNGQFLMTTDFYGATVKLYHLKMRFVEIYHHPVTRKVMRVSLASDEDLNKHLRGIRL